jgi:methylglyoxal synthase
MSSKGHVAFITTPQFRESRFDEAVAFILGHMFGLCAKFRITATGRTGELIQSLLERPPDGAARALIAESMELDEVTEHDLGRWRRTIGSSLTIIDGSLKGMIDITNQLIENRVDAVIHLTDYSDKSAKPDSSALARAANVYNVPIASDPLTAETYVIEWKRRALIGEAVFAKRVPLSPRPLDGIGPGDRVIAMIAHDNKKLDTCRFMVEHQRHIFENFDYILATGTTGHWLREFMLASGRTSADVTRIHCCKSGPLGGDVQIAFAIVSGLCRKAIFFQDPSVSHPHETDIRLFEQAVLSPTVSVQLATNAESARLLISAPDRRTEAVPSVGRSAA